MKRDWDVIRRILIEVEAMPSGELTSSDVPEPQEVVDYHMNLMIEAGLVEGRCVTTKTQTRDCRISRMTWKGHELLDNIRKNQNWNRIKAKAIEQGIDLTLDAITTIAKKLFSVLE